MLSELKAGNTGALPAILNKIWPHIEAIELFLQVVRTNSPDFSLSAENAQAVSNICSLLEGVPLALELAAARLKLFSPAALLNRLGGIKSVNKRSNSL